MGYKDLWDKIENRCLELAYKNLEKETAPTQKEIEAVKDYIAAAKEIELIKLHWAGISHVTARSDGAVNRFCEELPKFLCDTPLASRK